MQEENKIFLRRLLKSERIKKNLTLQALADLSGVGKSTIGNFETGKTSMSMRSLKTVFETLGIDDSVPSTAERPPPTVYPVPGDAAASAMLLRERPNDTGSRLGALERRVAAMEQALVRLVAGNPTGGDS
jgi:transcriptional regulator with XRE-family HTH domain